MTPDASTPDPVGTKPTAQAEPLNDQIERLANYIMAHHWKEIVDAGACDVAILTMTHQAERIAELEGAATLGSDASA